MDQNLPTLDIADIDFVENVAHINNPNITINAPLQNIEEISDGGLGLYIHRLYNTKIIYLGDNDYFLEKEIFHPHIFRSLRDQYNNTETFVRYVNDILREKIEYYDYRKIIERYKPEYLSRWDWEMGKSAYFLDYCSAMRSFLTANYKDKLYTKQNIRFHKVFMIGFNCDKCGKYSCDYDFNIQKFVFIPFLTSRTYCDINEDDNYQYRDLDRYVFYIQGKHTSDYCEECFKSLPWYLPVAEKKLLVARILRQYGVPDDLCFYCVKIKYDINYK